MGEDTPGEEITVRLKPCRREIKERLLGKVQIVWR